METQPQPLPSEPTLADILNKIEAEGNVNDQIAKDISQTDDLKSAVKASLRSELAKKISIVCLVLLCILVFIEIGKEPHPKLAYHSIMNNSIADSSKITEQAFRLPAESREKDSCVSGDLLVDTDTMQYYNYIGNNFMSYHFHSPVQGGWKDVYTRRHFTQPNFSLFYFDSTKIKCSEPTLAGDPNEIIKMSDSCVSESNKFRLLYYPNLSNKTSNFIYHGQEDVFYCATGAKNSDIFYEDSLKAVDCSYSGLNKAMWLPLKFPQPISFDSMMLKKHYYAVYRRMPDRSKNDSLINWHKFICPKNDSLADFPKFDFISKGYFVTHEETIIEPEYWANLDSTLQMLENKYQFLLLEDSLETEYCQKVVDRLEKENLKNKKFPKISRQMNPNILDKQE